MLVNVAFPITTVSCRYMPSTPDPFVSYWMEKGIASLKKAAEEDF